MIYPYATPEQRKIIYEKLIEDIDKGYSFFMCNRIVSYTTQQKSSAFEVLDIFTELWDSRPSNIYDHMKYGIHWFWSTPKGMMQRKECLLKAIQLCH